MLWKSNIFLVLFETEIGAGMLSSCPIGRCDLIVAAVSIYDFSSSSLKLLRITFFSKWYKIL